MSFLLDTHVWLWMLTDPGRLTPETQELVADASADLVLSSASSWEIAIKYGLGRLHLPEPPASYVPSRMFTTAVRGLSVAHAHALEVAALPMNHRDPFDRLLIAQARVEGLTLITVDPLFDSYDVDVMRA